jgi:hypothetical protein
MTFNGIPLTAENLLEVLGRVQVEAQPAQLSFGRLIPKAGVHVRGASAESDPWLVVGPMDEEGGADSMVICDEQGATALMELRNHFVQVAGLKAGKVCDKDPDSRGW